MVIPLLSFAAGLFLLVKGADIATSKASALARRAGVSPIFVGSTVIAFGTSLPELAVTTEAFTRSETAVGMGNIVGSNIANIALILGLCAILRPAGLVRGNRRGDLVKYSVFMVASTVLFSVLSMRPALDAISGAVSLACFLAVFTLVPRLVDDDPAGGPPLPGPLYLFLVTVAALLAVIAGSHLFLSGSLGIARLFSIPEWFTGFTLVAVGTSLPELATSISAILKGEGGIATGNILGSNIFNLLFVLGANSLFFSLPPPDPAVLALLLGFSCAAVVPAAGKVGINRLWGTCVLSAYLVYILAALFVA
ncbi:MAG: sodium:calcium antiporter [Methanolinea sp.]|nr:sodium:calcium antiporter [Methanolinea sp.]